MENRRNLMVEDRMAYNLKLVVNVDEDHKVVLYQSRCLAEL